MKSKYFKIIVSAAFIFFVISYLYIVYASYVDAPYFDSWRLFAGDNFFYNHIIIHNEHIINAIAAWFRLDEKVTGGSGVLQLLIIFMFLISLILIYTRGYREISVYEILLFIAITLSGTQFTNITWSFQIGFLGSFVIGCWSIYLLMIASNSRIPLFWLAFSLLLAATSAMSLASGILLLPILAAFSITACGRNTTTYSYTLLTTFLFVYLSYRSASGTSPHSIEIIKSIIFTFAVIGSFFGSILDLRFITGASTDSIYVSASILVGALMSVWFLFLVVRIYRLKDKAAISADDAWSLVAIVWLGASAGAIGLGRSNLPMVEAISSRYVTISCIFTCLLMVASRKLNLNLMKPYTMRAVCSLVVGIAVLAQCDRMAQAEVAGRRFENAESALLNGAYDSTDIQNLFPVTMTQSAKRISEIMGLSATSVFGEQRYRLISRHLFDGLMTYAGACPATHLVSKLGSSTYKIEGDAIGGARTIVIVADADSKVLSVASSRKPMIGLRAEGKLSGFVLVAPKAALDSDHNARLFAVTASHLTFCYIGSQNFSE